MLTLREALIIRKHEGVSKTLQVYESVPAGSVSNGSTSGFPFVPPDGYTFIPLSFMVGAMPIGKLKLTIKIDSIAVIKDVTSTIALEPELNAMLWGKMVEKKLEVEIRNTDLAAHYADFLIHGVLVPDGEVLPLIEHLTEGFVPPGQLRRIPEKIE